MITSYTPNIGRNFFTFSILGIISKATNLLASSNISGTIEECINTYCDIHEIGWDGFEPPLNKDLMKSTDKTAHTTTYTEDNYVRQQNEKDFQFIKRIIENYTVDNEGVAGYQVVHTTENGKNKLITRNPNAMVVTDHYIVQSENSQVIQWSPEIKMSAAASDQGSALDMNSIQPGTGDEQQTSYNDFITKKARIDGNITQTIKNSANLNSSQIKYAGSLDNSELLGKSVSNIAQGTVEPTTIFNKGLNRFLTSNNLKNLGTLTVEGNPHIQPATKIEITYFYPHSYNSSSGTGRKHYTSGIYSVLNVSHSVELGNFITTLTVMRHSHSISPGS
jgi:hypothetical protein